MASPETVARICGLLRAGLKREDAWVEAGASKYFFYRWKREDPGFAAAIAEAESASGWGKRRRVTTWKGSTCPPEQAERVCKLLKEGWSQRHAAIEAGIGERRFYRWMKRDQAFAATIRAAETEAAEGGVEKRIRRRSEKRTRERADRLCALLAKGSIRADAFIEVGISRQTFFLWRNLDPAFAKLVGKAEAKGAKMRRRTLRDRRSTRSDEVIGRFLKLLKEGWKRNEALREIGVRYPTFYGWRLRDPKILRAIHRAEAFFLNRRMDMLQRAADREWRNVAWLLSKRCPREFGPRSWFYYEQEEREQEEMFQLSEEQVLMRLAEIKAAVDLREASNESAFE